MIFAKGLGVPEGPVLLPDNSWVCVEMSADRGCVSHISADGKTIRMIAKTGRPNGLAVDKDGFMWVAESSEPSLLRLSMDGEVEVFLTACNGDPFLFPNDLAFGPDGALYLTDSGVKFEEFAPGGQVRPDYLTLDFDGRVYRIDIQTKEIRKLDTGIQFTNGIAFDAENNLYANETLTGDIFRYPWQDGQVGGREYFGNVIAPDAPEGFKGPDGMKFGENGRLYVAVFTQGDVTVLDPDGAVVERIKTEGNLPTNLAFGPRGSQEIYVTEDEIGTLEVFKVGTDGLPLHTGA
jgi:gluconolactonase